MAWTRSSCKTVYGRYFRLCTCSVSLVRGLDLLYDGCLRYSNIWTNWLVYMKPGVYRGLCKAECKTVWLLWLNETSLWLAARYSPSDVSSARKARHEELRYGYSVLQTGFWPGPSTYKAWMHVTDVQLQKETRDAQASAPTSYSEDLGFWPRSGGGLFPRRFLVVFHTFSTE